MKDDCQKEARANHKPLEPKTTNDLLTDKFLRAKRYNALNSGKSECFGRCLACDGIFR